MSKLVYKSINEIINKKFMTELNTGDKMSPEEKTDEIKQVAAKKEKKDAQNRFNDAAVLDRQIELKKTIARKKRDDEAQQQDENFDAQAVPGAAPVGMPPTAAPAPAPAPRPAAAPNYEGGNMTKTQLCQAHEATSNIMASIEDYDSLPDWVKAKITLASEYLVKCESFLNAKDQEHEDSQDEHMPKAPTPPAPSPMKPSTGGGTPMMGISLGRVQSVSPGE